MYASIEFVGFMCFWLYLFNVPHEYLEHTRKMSEMSKCPRLRSWADPLSKPHPQNLTVGKVRLVGTQLLIQEEAGAEIKHLRGEHSSPPRQSPRGYRQRHLLWFPVTLFHSS